MYIYIYICFYTREINQIYQSSWAHLPCKIFHGNPNLQLSKSWRYVPLFRTAKPLLVPGGPQSRCGRRGPPVKDHQGGVRWRVSQGWWWDIKKHEHMWKYVYSTNELRDDISKWAKCKVELEEMRLTWVWPRDLLLIFWSLMDHDQWRCLGDLPTAQFLPETNSSHLKTRNLFLTSVFWNGFLAGNQAAASSWLSGIVLRIMEIRERSRPNEADDIGEDWSKLNIWRFRAHLI